MASIKPEFDKRGVKIIAISTDPIDNHARWASEIESSQGTAPNYPIIGDSDHAIAKAYGMLPSDVEGDATARTPAQNATLRNVFVIGPDKKIRLVLIYPMTTGRNFDEVLRVIDSLQLTARNQVATPAQWRQGDKVIIAGSVSNEQARERYPEGGRSRSPTSASSRSRKASAPWRGAGRSARGRAVQLVEDALRDREGAVGGRHAGVDAGLQEDLADLLARQVVGERRADVHLQLVLLAERRERAEHEQGGGSGGRAPAGSRRCPHAARVMYSWKGCVNGVVAAIARSTWASPSTSRRTFMPAS